MPAPVPATVPDDVPVRPVDDETERLIAADPHGHARRERHELLAHVNRATDKPLIALSFVWIGLTILDLVRGLNGPLQVAFYVLWGLFVADFVIEFVIAPGKKAYLKKHWIEAVSLLLPALRVLRVLNLFRSLRLLRLARSARAVRAVGLARLLARLNRGLRAIGETLGRRGAGYVVAATILVTFGGAAGMWAFESPDALRADGIDAAPGDGLDGYGQAVWWTAMLMTTLGSEYWPQTIEGRVLCWVLALYAFAVFGYITATIASYFVGQESGPAGGDEVSADDLQSLREEIAALRASLKRDA